MAWTREPSGSLASARHDLGHFRIGYVLLDRAQAARLVHDLRYYPFDVVPSATLVRRAVDYAPYDPRHPLPHVATRSALAEVALGRLVIVVLPEILQDPLHARIHAFGRRLCMNDSFTGAIIDRMDPNRARQDPLRQVHAAARIAPRRKPPPAREPRCQLDLVRLNRERDRPRQVLPLHDLPDERPRPSDALCIAGAHGTEARHRRRLPPEHPCQAVQTDDLAEIVEYEYRDVVGRQQRV